MRALLLVTCLVATSPAWASLPSMEEVMGRSRGEGEADKSMEEISASDHERVKRQAGGTGDLGTDPNIVEVASLPMRGNEVDTRMMPTIGNGMIGTTVYGQYVYLNGVYNGDEITSHRARIPALVMTRVSLQPETETTAIRKFYMNAETGVFTEKIICDFGKIYHNTYIHSKYPRLLVTDIYAERTGARGGTIQLEYPQLNQSQDFNWGIPQERDFRWSVTGTTKEAEPGENPVTVHIYFHLPQSQIVMQGSTYKANRTMVMAIDRTDAAARNEYDIANDIMSERFCNNNPSQGPCGHYKLMQKHIEHWRKTWYSGRVEVDGNIELDKTARFSQFYMLASLPPEYAQYPPQISDVFVGASRSSLGRGGAVGEDNMGHVMWDSEVYVLPAILPMHPWHAKQILKYRSQRSFQAQAYAEELGLRGARYPWRGGASGTPLTPDLCKECNQRRHHINGGIAYGIRMYYSATRDRDYLTNPEWRGCDVTKAIAEFYADIAKYNTSKGRFDISGVTGPDDSHPNVWNNAYTNVVASLAIHWARYMSCLCGRVSREEIPDEWVQIALYLHLPYDTINRRHHQYEGFDSGHHKAVVNTKELARDKELNQLLEEIGNSNADAIVQPQARTDDLRRPDIITHEKFLDAEVASYRRAAYASTTKTTYESQRKAYLRFCLFFGYQPLPASNIILGRYAAFLARTLKPSSISGYMNIVRILHLENNLQNPLQDNWYLNTILRGINRDKGSPPKRKLPITVDILLQMHSQLDLKVSFNATFWAACTVAFFTFFRKSTLLSKSATLHNPQKNLCHQDLQFTEEGVIIKVKHTKTIQCGERILQVPVPKITGSPLCPVTALRNMLSACQQEIPQEAALFSYSAKGQLCSLTYNKFVTALKSVLKACGINENEYSGHSFRRGGASHSFACGVNVFWIKTQGDWASNAFERYLSIPLQLRWKLVQQMAENLQQT